MSIVKPMEWFKNYIGSAPAVQLPTLITALSSRELEVLRWLASGLTIEQAAKNMQKADGRPLGKETAKDYAKELYKKLGIANRATLTRFAIAEGVIALPNGDDLRELVAACSNFTENRWKVFEQVALGKTNEQGAAALSMNAATYADNKNYIYSALRGFAFDRVTEHSEAGSAAKATIAWVALEQLAHRLAASPDTDVYTDPANDINRPATPALRHILAQNGNCSHACSKQKSESIGCFSVTYKQGLDNDRILEQILRRDTPTRPRLSVRR